MNYFPKNYPPVDKPVAGKRSKKKPDEKHHNFGRTQHPKTNLSANMSWFALQFAGAAGNISVAARNVRYNRAREMLVEKDAHQLELLLSEARSLETKLLSLYSEVKRLNKEKKWK